MPSPQHRDHRRGSTLRIDHHDAHHAGLHRVGERGSSEERTHARSRNGRHVRSHVNRPAVLRVQRRRPVGRRHDEQVWRERDRLDATVGASAAPRLVARIERRPEAHPERNISGLDFKFSRLFRSRL